MKLFISNAAFNGLNSLLGGTLALSEGPDSPNAQALWLFTGISALTSISTLVVNFIIFRNRDAAVKLAEPVIMEFRKELATREDVKTAKAFTGRVQVETHHGFTKLETLIREETRRLYDKIDPLEKSVAASEADIANLRTAVRDLRNQ